MTDFDALGEPGAEESAFFEDDQRNEPDVTRQAVIDNKGKQPVQHVEEEPEQEEPEQVEEPEQEEEPQQEEAAEEEGEEGDRRVPLQRLLQERQWRQDLGRQLQEERKRFETANERLQRLYDAMEKQGQQAQQKAQPQQKEAPDWEADPLAYLKHEIESIKNVEQQRAQEAEQRRLEQENYHKQQETVARFQETLVNAEEQFRQQHNDYDDAFDYLADQRRQELASWGYNPQQREQIMMQELMQVSAHLLSNGQNPAERFYAMAQQKGYGRPQKPKKNPSKVQQLAENKKRTQAPSGGKGADAGAPTIEALSDMSDTEFDKWFEQLYKET